MWLLLALACKQDPCAGIQGPKLFVVAPDHEHRHLSEGDRTFTSIQDALDRAKPGTTICVGDGLYRETPSVFTEDIRLFGGGAGAAIIEPPGAPRPEDSTVLHLGADDLHVRGFTVRHGSTGVFVEPGTEVLLEELSVEANGVGLLASETGGLTLRELDLERNTRIGLLATASSSNRHETLLIEGGRIVGNGNLKESEVGGLYTDTDLELRNVVVRDNTGQLAGDLRTQGHLSLSQVVVERPATIGGAPRMVAQDGATLRDVRLDTAGSPGLSVSCRDRGLEGSNLALADSHGGSPSMRLQGCTGSLLHVTMLDSSGQGQAALELSGEGQLELANSAVVGFAEVAEERRSNAGLHLGATFVGSAEEAQLLRPLPVDPDLRPQSDSPLVDRGDHLGVEHDLDGRPRPAGEAPDLGAYELY